MSTQHRGSRSSHRLRGRLLTVALVPVMLAAALLTLSVAWLGAQLDPADEFDLVPNGEGLWTEAGSDQDMQPSCKEWLAPA